MSEVEEAHFPIVQREFEKRKWERAFEKILKEFQVVSFLYQPKMASNPADTNMMLIRTILEDGRGNLDSGPSINIKGLSRGTLISQISGKYVTFFETNSDAWVAQVVQSTFKSRIVCCGYFLAPDIAYNYFREQFTTEEAELVQSNIGGFSIILERYDHGKPTYNMLIIDCDKVVLWDRNNVCP